jgi:hypothetical protein
MLWYGSKDLKLVIIALNNSLEKRVELASRATADFLNNAIFNLGGPVKSLAAYLGAIRRSSRGMFASGNCS